MKAIARLSAVCFAVLFAAVPAKAGETVVEPGEGALARAIENAAPGDILRLRPGTYRGSFMVDRPLTLKGGDGVELNGMGEGSVLTVDAPDVTVSGLAVKGSGSSHETLDAGIKLTRKAARAQVSGNVLTGNLHGIDVHGAQDALVSGNKIVGRTDHRMNERGNGVYVWNAPGAIVEGNTISLGRDGIFVNISRKNTFSNNRFENLRFAIHYMYANDSQIIGNISVGNHLGYAIMYSSRVELRGNTSIGDRNHGIMLNYTNQAVIENNLVRDGGEKCLFMYNANKNRLIGNRFEGCAIGIHFTAGSDRNDIYDNAFIGNRTQVKYVGTRDHEWSFEGRGNYWSDHTAFDVNGDGIADQSYRPNDRIDQVLWTQPSAKFLLGSPAIQLIRWAQKEFPALLPGGVVDSAPLMKPVDPIEAFQRERALSVSRNMPEAMGAMVRGEPQ